MPRDNRKNLKTEIAILTFDCEQYNSLGPAYNQAKKLPKGTISGAREIWAVKKVISWSKESRRLEERESNKVILYFFGEKYSAIKDLLSDPSLPEFLECTGAKIFITEQKIPWPEQKEEDNKEE